MSKTMLSDCLFRPNKVQRYLVFYHINQCFPNKNWLANLLITVPPSFDPSHIVVHMT